MYLFPCVAWFIYFPALRLLAVLTKKKQDLRWPLNFSIIPILAPVAAYDSIYYTDIMYKAKKPSFANIGKNHYIYGWSMAVCL